MPSVSTAAVLLLAAGLAFGSPISQDVQDIGPLKGIRWPKGRPLPVKVTRTRSGQHLGWIKREAQIDGAIASPPPPTDFKEIAGRRHGKSELLLPGAETGPEGTVPFTLVTEEAARNLIKGPAPVTLADGSLLSERSTQAGNPHYYGNSNQGVTNYGSCAYLSLFSPNVSAHNSMSLIQIAEANAQTGVLQTAEAGWQNYPDLNNGSFVPHIFTYFNTNGYTATGDNVGGYDTLQKGWVQVDQNYYPGMTFANISKIGGSQYEIPLAYHYYQNNWWLSINNAWAGYYPGSVYAINGSTTNTLGAFADQVAWYGEVADAFAPPPTDMGSGKFANTGYGNAAYMHNIIYYKDTNNNAVNYTGSPGQSNSSWYTIETHYNSGQSWWNYFYVGGPGAS